MADMSGHNINEMHVNAFRGATQELESAKELFKARCKALEAEGADLDILKVLVKLETPEGEAKVRAVAETIATAAKWVGLQMGFDF